MRRPVLKSLTVVILMWLLAMPLFAQPIWLHQNNESYIGVEALKPNFEGEPNLTFVSSVIFVSGRFMIGDAIAIAGELPISHFGDDNDSETMIGNPYIGLEFRKPDGTFFIELGGRIPIAPDDKLGAALLGAFTDFDRLEALLPDVVTFSGKVNFQTANSSNVVFRLRGGPTLLANSDSQNFIDNDNSEWLIDYSGQIGLQGEQISVFGGITGRYLASGEGDFGEKSIHQLIGSANIDLGSVRPGIQLRFPLE